MKERSVNRGHVIGSTVLGSVLMTAMAIPALAQNAAVPAVVNTTQEALQNVKPADWLHTHRTYDGQRFSPLDQINLGNIKKLELAYTIAVSGVDGGGSRYANASLEGTPVVEDGAMYFTNGWGVLYKMDARNRNTGLINWVMDPQVDKPWSGDVACCGINNRGIGLWKDKVISVSLDGRIIATSKATGEIVWQTKDADPALGETFTVAPLVIKDIAIVGPAGAEYGIRGWLDGIDLNTGKRAWRTFTVAGPDDPLGNGKTWAKTTYRTGGGSIWVTGTYDPAANLTYWGTGNPGPDWDAEYRPGDNLYTDSALAMTPETGKIVWFFQYTPNDPYDYDEIGEHPLVNVTIDGQPRQITFHAGRNGFFYGMDRKTGQFLYGKQYVDTVSWTPGVDPKTGRPIAYDPTKQVQDYVKGATPKRDGGVATLCPLITGGKNWQPSAYSPKTELAYVAGGEGCQQRITQVEKGPADEGGTWKPRDRFVGGIGPDADAPPANPAWKVQEYGSLAAIDVKTGNTTKKIKLNFVNRSGVLATAGDFIMIDEPDGWIRAFHHQTLDEVWKYNVGASIKGPPMSFMADGVQYIAILVGAAPSSAQMKAYPEVSKFTPSHMLYVFRLDEDLLPKKG